MSSQQHSCICIFIQLPVKRFTKNCECCVNIMLKYFWFDFYSLVLELVSREFPQGSQLKAAEYLMQTAKTKVAWNYYGAIMWRVQQKYHTISLSYKRTIVCTMESAKNILSRAISKREPEMYLSLVQPSGQWPSLIGIYLYEYRSFTQIEFFHNTL